MSADAEEVVARLHSNSTRQAAPILDVEVCPWSSYPRTYPKQDSVTRLLSA